MNDHQLEDRIRAAIRVIADEPAFAPPPQRVSVSNHRPRQTFRGWVPAVAALTVAVITAVIVTNPFPQPAKQVTVAPSFSNLPIHVPASSAQFPKLSESPLGQPALAVVYQGAATPEPGGRQAVLVAEDGQAFRRIDLAEQRGAIGELQRWFNAITLLSPDGRKVAVGDGRGGAIDMVIVDVVTGERRVYPLAKSVYYRMLAWSPDGTRVVMVMRDEPSRTGDSVVWKDKADFQLVVLDVDTGAMAAVGETTSSVVITAHFSPAGGLVVAEPERLRFFDLTTGPGGSLVRAMQQPGGGDFAAWSKDQSMLVFVNANTSGTQVWFRDAASDSTPRRPIHLADRVASFAGWKSPDEILLYTRIANVPGSSQLIVLSVATGQTTPLAVFNDPEAIGVRVAARLISDFASQSAAPIATASERGGTPWAIWVSSGVLLILLVLYLVRRWHSRRREAR